MRSRLGECLSDLVEQGIYAAAYLLYNDHRFEVQSSARFVVNVLWGCRFHPLLAKRIERYNKKLSQKEE